MPPQAAIKSPSAQAPPCGACMSQPSTIMEQDLRLAMTGRPMTASVNDAFRNEAAGERDVLHARHSLRRPRGKNNAEGDDCCSE